MASSHPEQLFLACEGGSNIAIRILQKCKAQELANLRVIRAYADDLSAFFGDGELDGIFINFCDPWPKARHARRRLTHRRMLEQYRRAVKPGGYLRFKTDNDGLFDFSLEEFAAAGLAPAAVTRDLHASPFAAENIMTEYEERFSAEGKNINYAEILF
jgi:tRNA (guanine-N7-)-methyltransferase